MSPFDYRTAQKCRTKGNTGRQKAVSGRTDQRWETFMKVRDAMSPEVQLCTPDDTLKDAAEAMAALNVGLLPVTDNERLVGMVSDRDIAIRGVGLGRGPDCRVGDVMSAEVKYCYDDQDLDD